MKPRRQIWVIGGGEFGLKAATRLLRDTRPWKVTVVEECQSRCRMLDALPITCRHQDGVRFLVEQLGGMAGPEWIVPMVPFHLAFAWIRQVLQDEMEISSVDIPADLLRRLPNPIRGELGTVYASLADFRCPDHCPEPDRICTHTKQPRPYRLYDKIESEQSHGFSVIAIRSRQILPGVGGFRPEDLETARDRVMRSRNPILLGTACKCHGVLDLFQVRRIAKMKEKEYTAV